MRNIETVHPPPLHSTIAMIAIRDHFKHRQIRGRDDTPSNSARTDEAESIQPSQHRYAHPETRTALKMSPVQIPQTLPCSRYRAPNTPIVRTEFATTMLTPQSSEHITIRRSRCFHVGSKLSARRGHAVKQSDGNCSSDNRRQMECSVTACDTQFAND
jgi:hypothetical protein